MEPNIYTLYEYNKLNYDFLNNLKYWFDINNVKLKYPNKTYPSN